ncbi:hypothetical protein [Rhizobium rhizogenes]|uniref:hypothetical protein n=1 Tax=Rhizobium rhizogenes TaxID=359 RepID=UPI0022B6946D|nr:hypothetical protein [Rhizobium rhizogenes]MCZ7448252.1 hypothetical protein [Rhizobium rhizogenes]MCZ7465913.1 hypothetical protein [Rhizobium rhizogenes]
MENVTGDTEHEDKRHMPEELLRKVSEHLISDDALATVKNLTNLALTSKDTKRIVEDGDIGEHKRRITRLGSDARRLFDHAIPDSGLRPLTALVPIAPSQRHIYGGGAFTSVPVDDRTGAVSSIVKFQSTENKTRLVNAIFELTNEDQGKVLGKIGQHIGEFDEVNRKRLIDRAVELFILDEPKGGPLLGWSKAGEALVKAERYLDNEQSRYLSDQITQNSKLNRLYNRAIRDVRNEQEEASRAGEQVIVPDSLDRQISNMHSTVGAMLETGSTSIREFKENSTALRNTFDNLTASYDDRRRSRESSSLSR